MHFYKRGKTWWVKYYIIGKTPVYRSLKTSDRKVAQMIASEIVRKDERRRMGIDDAFTEHRERPIEEHVGEFHTWLSARGPVVKHVEDRINAVRSFVAWARIETLADLDVAKAIAWLAGVKKSGRSARTVNGRYRAIRQFAKMLVTTERLPRDPFVALTPLREADDRRHERRALTPEELTRLCQAAQSRSLEKARKQFVLAGVSAEHEAKLLAQGSARARLYRFAVATGLRAGELARLRWCDIDFKALTVTIPASSAKSRKVQMVPLHPVIAEELKSVRPKAALSKDLVFGRSGIPRPLTLWKDLEAAGIPRQDATGRWVDFHALRKTGITWLTVGGAHPRVVQMFARHASIETTMTAYTDVAMLDARHVVASMPLSPRLPVSADEPASV